MTSHRTTRWPLAALACATFAAGTQPARAQTTPGDNSISGSSPPGGLPVPNAEPLAPGDTYAERVWKRSNLFGDMGGLRGLLGDHGVTIGLQETSEVLGNVTGGAQKGFVYAGVTLLGIGVDTGRAFGLEGGTINLSAFQIHGGNLGLQNLRSLQTPSGIVGAPSTRLWELWYQQLFLDGDADVKIGQQSIDQEFDISSGASLFLNTVLGWPIVSSAGLYGGGPTYPLSSLGLRLRARPTGALTLLAGAFDDNPGDGTFNDNSQLRGNERYGARFNFNTGALFIAEAQYAVNQPANGDIVRPSNASDSQLANLPGTYRLGAWFDTGPFNSQRHDAAGLSLADPAGTGVPGQIHQNFSLYGVIDQMIWRPDPAQVRSLSVFLRANGAPGDRNLVEFSINAGLVVKAPLPGRDGDAFGVGYGLAKVSGAASRLDRDIAFYTAAPYQRRSSESFVEVTYQIQVNQWWQVQPDFQYVFMPGGGIPNPYFPRQRISNEAVFGVRTNITF